ncbi:MAG: hypothetical protein AAAC47_23145 [Pararhizobium sp.]
MHPCIETENWKGRGLFLDPVVGNAMLQNLGAAGGQIGCMILGIQSGSGETAFGLPIDKEAAR